MHTIKHQQIKRLQTARLYARGGVIEPSVTNPATDLDFFASELPDEEALYGLRVHLRELAHGAAASAKAAYDALNDVIIARENYDLEARRQPSPGRLASLATSWLSRRKRATCEIIALLDPRVGGSAARPTGSCRAVEG